MRLDEQPLAEIFQHLAVRTKLNDRLAGIVLAAVGDPEVVVTVDCDGIHWIEGPRRARPLLDLAIGVGKVGVGFGAGIARLAISGSGNRGGCEQGHGKPRHPITHHLSSPWTWPLDLA